MKLRQFISRTIPRRRRHFTDIDAASRVLNDKSSFETVETYKAIRTNVMFSMPKSDRGRVIAVTSASPGEGKTTTSINLAITFAQMGARVVLVDCDLRKSRVHRYLNLSRKNGISNVICGFSDLESAIQKGVRQNLDVLPAGEIPPNPAELMETDEFGKVIERLKDSYDYVFIDTPPITVVTDAAVVMKHSMGAVIVVRKDVTTYDLLDAAMENINNTGVKVLGAIVLGASERSKKYGYYRGGKYGYRYGYRYGYDYRYEYRYEDQDEQSDAKKSGKQA